ADQQVSILTTIGAVVASPPATIPTTQAPLLRRNVTRFATCISLIPISLHCPCFVSTTVEARLLHCNASSVATYVALHLVSSVS
ncbi:hypothetical protein S245_067682, partial [Arachis hypogaea]